MATLKKNAQGKWELITDACRWTVDNIAVNLDHIPPGNCSYTNVMLDELIRIFNKVGIIAPMYCKGREFTPEKFYIKDEKPQPVTRNTIVLPPEAEDYIDNEISGVNSELDGIKNRLNRLENLLNRDVKNDITSVENELKDLRNKHEKHWHVGRQGCFGGKPQY